MRFYGLGLAVLAASSQGVHASVNGAPGAEHTLCYTHVGQHPALGSIKTAWSTHYTDCCTTTATATVKTTVTPRTTYTKVIKHTHTVYAPSYVSVVTCTSTSTIYSTSVSTSVSVVTGPALTVNFTSTVPATSGFIPVQSSLPDSSYSGSGGPDPAEKKRRAAAAGKPQPKSSPNQGSSKNGLQSYKHQQGVTCGKWLPKNGRCWVGRATVTQGVKGYHTATVVRTRTVVVETTVAPRAHRTVTTTITTISVKTSVSVTVSTTTPTVSVAVATIYAACATNNMADAVGGITILEAEGGFQSVDDLTVDSAYDCCVAAFTTPNIGPWAFQPGTPGAINCFIGVTADTCPAQSSNPSVAITDASGSLVIGNGPCAEFNNAVPAVDPDE